MEILNTIASISIILALPMIVIWLTAPISSIFHHFFGYLALIFLGIAAEAYGFQNLGVFSMLYIHAVLISLFAIFTYLDRYETAKIEAKAAAQRVSAFEAPLGTLDVCKRYLSKDAVNILPANAVAAFYLRFCDALREGLEQKRIAYIATKNWPSATFGSFLKFIQTFIYQHEEAIQKKAVAAELEGIGLETKTANVCKEISAIDEDRLKTLRLKINRCIANLRRFHLEQAQYLKTVACELQFSPPQLQATSA